MMLPEISAILGIYQLKRIEEFVAKRNKIADIYDDVFDKLKSVEIIKCPSGNRSSYYKYPLILSEIIDKAKFTKILEKEFGVETGNVFYPPCHLQPVYIKLGFEASRGSLTTAEHVLFRTVTLPMHVALANEDAIYITECVRTVCERFS
jgi:dTDP-4-amino-4,6-dideoxygalactose transaminase